ncbi:hypothetical protein SH661x_004429 [Planctomicrobium sp. SH661]|uniref:hypothetical protein n=1 Tax=Planctomicrobium sp. SH661 TaxID=3448124 RepID=UPI003F5B7968
MPLLHPDVNMLLRRLGLLTFTLCLLIGCSKEKGPACYPVQGQVFLDQKPLADAMIEFHPIQSPDTHFPHPIAATNAQGRFQLTTLKLNDGAPPGDYAITVSLQELVPDGDEMVRKGRHLLPARYRDPARSELKYTVINGKNEVPALNVSSK